ncbi:MAG: M48 family metallopeptidase [Candidatus Omnitrophica bacterium]|nr:M48 family metallopeptidase [Candidatus Omnitrophota bacterium]
MNFFEHQEQARKRTLLLLFLYGLAVAGTILAVYIAARACWYLLWVTDIRTGAQVTSIRWWDPGFFLIVTGIVCSVVAAGTVLKVLQLSSGGAAVARMLGGEAIDPGTVDPDERKVLNVVEEMSIASGVPVPPVYLLNKEYGINAFAAGFSSRDAVIGVTRGAVRLLSRDELQGVIAHEFSHIFNGDMRLNMHLTGFLNGLLLIALTGKTILRGFRYGGSGRSGRGGAGAVLVIFLFAVLLVAVGYVGVFFCNWIKSGVSRQREFLADASSAQFTRNPSGLAGALKKVAGLSEGSFVWESRAEEVSHFFFSDGVNLSEDPILGTHPPLVQRIERLDPSFDGRYPEVTSIAPGPSKVHHRIKVALPKARKPEGWDRRAAIFGLPLATVAGLSAADTLVASVGTASQENLAEAGRILEELPRSLRDAARSLDGATALVYGLLIDRRKDEVRARQLDYLSRKAGPDVHRTLLGLLPDFSSLNLEFCLPLLDLATPMLKTQSPASYPAFREHLESLIAMNPEGTVFEFTVKQVVLHHLDFYFGKAPRPRPLHATIGALLPACGVLLSFLAGAGQISRAAAEKAFQKAARQLVPDHVWKFIPGESLAFENAEKALRDMASAFPGVKEQFLKACVSCVECDGRLEIRELELLRAFASTLDCPIPRSPVTGQARS